LVGFFFLPPPPTTHHEEKYLYNAKFRRIIHI
jgi:hypothetical protein